LRGKAARSAVDEALALTVLEERAGEPIKHLSGGYKRRVNIACALVHRPELLLLDEPTVGVDIDARQAIHTLIDHVRGQGMAIILTTHDLEQAQNLASRTGFLQQGRLIVEGAPQALLNEHFGNRQEIVMAFHHMPDAKAQVFLQGLDLKQQVNMPFWTGWTSEGWSALPVLAHQLETKGLSIKDMRLRAPTLDHLFTSLMQKGTAS
jgi:ABC-2 type transport system ATP-binding protein